MVITLGDSATTGIHTDIRLYDLTVLHMPMTENRSCVGLRTDRWNTATGGMIIAFIRVADAKAQRYMFSAESVDTTLCTAIAGDPGSGTSCETTPQGMWTTPPDSLCTDAKCTPNMSTMTVCDPATPEGSTSAGDRPGCNAWNLIGRFVAQGVDIT